MYRFKTRWVRLKSICNINWRIKFIPPVFTVTFSINIENCLFKIELKIEWFKIKSEKG